MNENTNENAYRKQEASLIFVQKESIALINGIGTVANVVCESAPTDEVHEQAQVRFSQDHRVCVHDVDMSLTNAGLQSNLIRDEGLQGHRNGPLDDFHCLLLPSVFTLAKERLSGPTHAQWLHMTPGTY